MSYILDAIKKSEAERNLGVSPGALASSTPVSRTTTSVRIMTVIVPWERLAAGGGAGFKPKASRRPSELHRANTGRGRVPEAVPENIGDRPDGLFEHAALAIWVVFRASNHEGHHTAALGD